MEIKGLTYPFVEAAFITFHVLIVRVMHDIFVIFNLKLALGLVVRTLPEHDLHFILTILQKEGVINVAAALYPVNGCNL